MQKRCRVKNRNLDFAAGSRKMPPTPVRNSLALLHDAPQPETRTKSVAFHDHASQQEIGLATTTQEPSCRDTNMSPVSTRPCLASRTLATWIYTKKNSTSSRQTSFPVPKTPLVYQGRIMAALTQSGMTYLQVYVCPIAGVQDLHFTGLDLSQCNSPACFFTSERQTKFTSTRQWYQGTNCRSTFADAFEMPRNVLQGSGGFRAVACVEVRTSREGTERQGGKLLGETDSDKTCATACCMQAHAPSRASKHQQHMRHGY